MRFVSGGSLLASFWATQRLHGAFEPPCGFALLLPGCVPLPGHTLRGWFGGAAAPHSCWHPSEPWDGAEGACRPEGRCSGVALGLQNHPLSSGEGSACCFQELPRLQEAEFGVSQGCSCPDPSVEAGQRPLCAQTRS